MMKAKNLRVMMAICIGVALSAAGNLAAEQLTTVAVVDVAKVYTSFFKESQQVRDLEALKKKTQEELDAYTKNLQKLLADRLKAMEEKRQDEVIRLEKDILSLQKFIGEYKKVKQNQINDAQQNLNQSDAFLKDLSAALKFVAEANGYSVILDMDNPYLRFWTPDVDITEQVLDRLKQTVTP